MYPTLAAALEYASLGYRVLPLKPGSKIPDLRHWPEEAGSDPGTIRRQFGAARSRAVAQLPHGLTDEALERRAMPNVGIATGNGLAVLDIDVEHGGEVPAWAPPTQTVRTPSGGLHLYYATDPGVPNSVGRLAPGVDVRGERGMVGAPPSILRVREQPPADAPPGAGFTEWVSEYSWEDERPIERIAADLLTPADLRQDYEGRSRRFEFADAVPVGARNNYLTSYAGWLFTQGEDRADVLEELTREAGRLKFTPRVSEINSIVRSVARYH